MDRAESYDDWRARAQAEDRRTGADRWKERERSRLYDYRVIRRRLEELVEIRATRDPHRLLFYLNEGVHGNMGGIGSPALYTRARFGTKTLITQYIDELVGALDDLAQCPARDVPSNEKLLLLRRTRDCFGRSALMMSGAGSLGAFHLGVAKALSEQDLVPKILSGASAGSLFAAMLGTHERAELAALFSPEGVTRSFESFLDPSPERFRRKRLRVEDLRALIAATVPDLTFGEAFEETGHYLNVCVAPASLHQRSRMLNASTSPNACIHEALLASCAVPGVFPAVTLAARDSRGQRRPYVPSRQWVDGSISDDLPARRLARLYGVNHFITSQANPIVLWALQDPHAVDGLLPRLGAISRAASQEMMRAIYPFAMDAVRNLYPANVYTRLWFSVVTQQYSADINIIPRQRLFDPRMLLARLTREETASLIEAGERATWPKIEMIRNCTRISRRIDEWIGRLQHRAGMRAEAAGGALSAGGLRGIGPAPRPQ